MRVLPDVGAIDRGFDYTVPSRFDADVRVGTIVRIDLHGRRVRGWVVADDVAPPPGVVLRPLAGVTGWGPPDDVVDLTTWASRRWAGPRAHLLDTASPPAAVRGLPRRDRTPPAPRPAAGTLGEALRRRRAVLRIPPTWSTSSLVADAVDAVPSGVLVVAPSVRAAEEMAAVLRRRGHDVALLPREWARARAGAAVVVGARASAFAPVADLRLVIVVDAHDEAHQEERAPTWVAWRVAAERARRAAAACVLTSPCPTLDVLAWAGPDAVLAPPRDRERRGWPAVVVVDRREADPREGLWSRPVVDAARSAGRVLCVLNRTGRARLLVCGACRETARCGTCGGAVSQRDDRLLACGRCGETRPVVCAACGSQRLVALRIGVTRAREELEALAGRPVGEVTASTAEVPSTPVLIGTEALLHRVDRADVVVFADLDQELLAPRFRAAEQAMALLARAARLVGGRSDGGRLVLQTSLARHAVVEAALHGDPGRVPDAEDPLRAALDLPPHTALARVEGPAADAFVAGLDRGVVGVAGAEGRWLVRAPDAETLVAALTAVTRPPGRLRVEVDPARV